jgi:hypothetical protein
MLTNIIRECLTLLEIPPMTFTLGSFRAGGATAHFLEQENLGTLQFRGRWKSTATLYHYVSVSMAAMSEARLTPTASHAVKAASDFFTKLGPPPHTLLVHVAK